MSAMDVPEQNGPGQLREIAAAAVAVVLVAAGLFLASSGPTVGGLIILVGLGLLILSVVTILRSRRQGVPTAEAPVGQVPQTVTARLDVSAWTRNGLPPGQSGDDHEVAPDAVPAPAVEGPGWSSEFTGAAPSADITHGRDWSDEASSMGVIDPEWCAGPYGAVALGHESQYDSDVEIVVDDGALSYAADLPIQRVAPDDHGLPTGQLIEPAWAHSLVPDDSPGAMSHGSVDCSELRGDDTGWSDAAVADQEWANPQEPRDVLADLGLRSRVLLDGDEADGRRGGRVSVQRPMAGWYLDPVAGGCARFFDGSVWTAFTHSIG